MDNRIQVMMNRYIIALKKKNKTRIYKTGFWAALTIIVLVLFHLLPDPVFDPPYSTILRSADGQLMNTLIADDEQWRFPPSDSLYYRFSVAARLFEDEYFYYHHGVNPVSIIRAMVQNFKSGKVVSGGSTITMQTIRIAMGNQKRTYGQKLIETLAALKFELFHSKNDIFKLYQDNAPFGGNIVGLTAASWQYFGRSPDKLSWAETAFLAVLPNNPALRFSKENEPRILNKRNRLLRKLQSRGFIKANDLYLSLQEPLPGDLKTMPDLAEHLLFRTVKEGNKGKNIITTIDYRLHKQIEEYVNRYSRKMAANEIYNAAALVIEIKTGHVVAYVGNANSQGEYGQHVDIITAQRSPGSLLKPILYAASLDQGIILPKELIPDVPIIYKGFSPKNFDMKFRGAVHADAALASSLNVPFVYLLKEFGYQVFHQKLKSMGMKSLTYPADHYGFSLILGGAETSLWEITGIYASMARSYFNFRSNGINSAGDYFENDYIMKDKTKLQKANTDAGYLNPASLGYTFRAMQKLKRPLEESGWKYFVSSIPIAWKTGTSYGFRDAWAVGINGKYVVGVWLGNADGEGRPGLTGILSAAPLLFSIFRSLEGGVNFEDTFGVDAMICRESGMIATDNCPDKTYEVVPEKASEGKLCRYHQKLHLSTDLKWQVNSSCYAVGNMKNLTWFVLPPVQAWYFKQFNNRYREPPPFLPACQNVAKKSEIGMIYPRRFTKVFIPREQDGKRGKAIFEAAHVQNDATIFWHLDDTYLGQTRYQHQMGIRTSKGKHKLVLIDDQGNELDRIFEVMN